MANSPPGSSPWTNLAAAVVARRDELGLSQLDVATRGSLSIDRIQAIEGAKAAGYRASTFRALERGLDWVEGSVRRILDGDAPIPRPVTGAPAVTADIDLPDLSHLTPDVRREFIRRAMDKLPMIKEFFPGLYELAQDQIIELTRKYGDDEDEAKAHSK